MNAASLYGCKSIRCLTAVLESNEQRFAYLDRILPCSSNNLPTVKLQPGNGMIILEGFKYSTATKIPNLVRGGSE